VRIVLVWRYYPADGHIPGTWVVLRHGKHFAYLWEFDR
jgi:hypothetical protein